MKITDAVKRPFQKVKMEIDFHKNCRNEIEELQNQVKWFMDHSDITKLKPATGYLRKKQLKLVAFADEFFDYIKELEIQPFLIGGNLIGAYRHQGYVPWDDDLDFGLIREDYERLIDFCRKKCVIEIYNGSWGNYNSDKHIARLDKVVSEHPNEYILDIWLDQIQITRGTSCIDRMAIDFWAFDYYSEDYDISDHMEYLKKLSFQKRNIDNVNEIISFLEEERIENNHISKQATSRIFPGIDNIEGYLRRERIKKWIDASDVFPLKKVKYEDTCFWVPNNIEGFLEYEYPDYMEYPQDAGRAPHEGYKEKYIVNNLPTVEFYLIDAFEIYHFLPFYYYFERNGIYARFVAEPVEENTSGKWFDYQQAIEILELNGVRYSRQCNPQCDFAFSTQDAYLLKKYTKNKIHVAYGMGLTSYSFCESKRSIDGFDLKLVHGNCAYQYVRKTDSNIPLIKIGYPRYMHGFEPLYLYDEGEVVERIEQQNVDHKPLLLYFPTWDEASSIQYYACAMKKLREKFFIVTKAHHCTYRLESEKENLSMLFEISDVVLEGNYRFESAVQLGNLVVCDAISGSATEVPYLNPDVRLILLYSPLQEKNSFKEFIEDYALCVKHPESLVKCVEDICQADKYQGFRSEMLKNLYERNIEEGFEKLKEFIKNHHHNGIGKKG